MTGNPACRLLRPVATDFADSRRLRARSLKVPPDCDFHPGFAPVFRYFDVLDCYRDFGIISESSKVVAWRAALHKRPSVQTAVVRDYPQLLHQFILARNSQLSQIASGLKP